MKRLEGHTKHWKMVLRWFVFLLLLAGVHGRHEYSQLEMDLAGEAVEGSGESGSRLVTFRNNYQNQTLLLQWTGSLQDDESHMSNPILITEALRGEEVKVNTFDGHIFLIQVKETLKVVGDKVTILEGVDFYDVGPSSLSLSSTREGEGDDDEGSEDEEDRGASRRRRTRGVRNKRAQELEQEQEQEQEGDEWHQDSETPPVAIDLVSPPGSKSKAKTQNRSILQQPPVKPSPPLRYKKDANLPYPHPNAAIKLLGTITTAMSAKFRSLVCVLCAVCCALCVLCCVLCAVSCVLCAVCAVYVLTPSFSINNTNTIY